MMSALHNVTADLGEQENNCTEILDELLRKINVGESLKESMNPFLHIKGAPKLQRKVHQELSFLRRVMQHKCVKAVHVKCSNLGHLEAHINYVLNQPDNCTSIMETFEFLSPEGSRRLCVDVVKDDGLTWVKVIARNARALTLSSTGDGEYGQRSIIDQAKEYLLCAKQHPHHFKIPKISMIFAGGIEIPLANALEKLQIDVQGSRISHSDQKSNLSDDSDYEGGSLDDTALALERVTLLDYAELRESVDCPCRDSSRFDTALNLDITAMIAYVSALTNGGSNAQFKEVLLNQQANWEIERPVKAFLDNLFEGKKLYCCKAAHDDFCKIIYSLGGPLEVQRAENLLHRMIVVPDQLSERTQNYLKEGGKIKKRSRIIFGTGDQMKAKTVTANQGFVRAAKSQGLTYSVVYHESRALTERKALPAGNETNTD